MENVCVAMRLALVGFFCVSGFFCPSLLSGEGGGIVVVKEAYLCEKRPTVVAKEAYTCLSLLSGEGGGIVVVKEAYCCGKRGLYVS